MRCCCVLEISSFFVSTWIGRVLYVFFFFFNDTATTEIYTLSLHDALPISLRLAAGARGTTYLELRLNVLEFLDATPDTLTTDDLTEFVQPRIARWDVNLETGVLWVALRGHEPRERGRGRAPGRRATGGSPAGDDGLGP